MQKTTTRKDFKVYLLKTFLSILILGISFQVSFAQQQKALTKPASATKGLPTERPAVTPAATTSIRPSTKKTFAGVVGAAEPTDVPATNKMIAAKMQSNPAAFKGGSLPTPNLINDVCTFTGSLAAGDATIAGARLFRDGSLMSCGFTRACPGTSGAGPYFYDTYTMQNLTCASQCVTVSYIADGTSGDCFVTAYSNSYNSANVCTNYKADGGLSSLAGGTPVSFSFTMAPNETIVLVVNEAVPSTTCDHYTMTVTGINCAAPPPCVPITASVLSQVQIPGPPVNLFSEQFDGAIPPAGWPIQNLSNPVGLTNWSQTNSLVFAPQSGAGFASANFNNTSGVGTISDWMFAPQVTFKNGDKFSFYTRTTTGTFPDRLQLRQSTNGASVNVGTSETSVGDFTTLLLDINPTLTGTGYPTAWTQYTVTMSGLPAAGVSGRLAFRYFVTGGGPAGANSDFIGIDNAVYTSFTTINPTTCTGSTANLKVDMTGGDPSYTYDLIIHPSVGADFPVTGYTSGANIPVTPAVTTTYSLVSVIVHGNPCCVGTGNSGTPTITVSPTTVAPITVTASPSTPLCAGDPTLLTIIGAPTAGTATVSSGPIAVAIPDANATGVSTPLTVSGIPGTAVGTSASVNFNITHTWDGDLTLFLKAPNNQVLNLVNARGGSADNFVNTTISSTAVTPVSAGAAPFTGTFLPDGSLAAAPPTGFTPTATTFAPLYNTAGTLNGNWLFAARDNAGGDLGTITSWSLTLNYSVPAGPPVGYTFLWSPPNGLSSVTANPVAASPATTTTYTVLGTAPNGCQTTGAITINVNQLPAVVTPPSNLTICANSNATFSIVGSGAGISYQWQVSTNGGGSYTNITNAAPYSGATTNTLVITGAPATFNTYRYRCVVSGTCPPNAISAAAILTVNPLPAVTVSPVSPVCGGLPGVSGTLLTASGASTYVWSPAAGLFTNAAATIPYVAGTPTATVYAAPTVNTTYTITGTNGTTGCIGTLKVDVNYKPAAPTVNPSAVTMCLGNPAVPLSITSALAPSPFTSTYSSGTISVAIPDNNLAGATSTINVPLPTTAAITSMSVAFNINHTWDGDLVMVLKAPNNAILNLDYYLTGTGGAGVTSGFTNTRVSSTGTAALSSGTNPYNGIFKADAAGPASSPAAGPTGMLPTVGTFAGLYSIPNGNWTLGMYDGGAGDVGTLTSWSLTFNYLYGPPASGVWSPVAGLWLDANATIPYAGTSVNTVYAKPGSSTTYNVTVTSIGPDATPTFSNTAAITINDGSVATPYPAGIAVSGLPTTGVSVNSVTVSGISHTWSDDIDVLLQSPTGQNVILMSDVGGAAILNNVTYTFSDAAAGALSLTAGNATGTYLPTDGAPNDNWPAPGPGAFVGPNPALATFTGNFNGTWKLFVVDDTFGDQGSISGGYSINFKYATVGCVSNATQVPVTVNLPLTFPTQPVDAVVCTDKVTSFTTVAAGSVVNHNWRVSTTNGNTWTDVANGGVYAGAKTGTLTITAPPVSMNGYLYKDSVSTVACRDSSSRIVKLTVNPLPTIVIGASPVTKLFPGKTTTLFSTVTPAAATYTWLRGGVAVPGATASSYLVTVDGLGDYTLRVTDVNGCTNLSNQVSITDSVSGRVFIYPNPSNGLFQVRYWSIINNTNLPRGINVYDARGKRVLTQNYSISSPYGRMDVDLRNQGTGVYWIEVVDVVGNRLAMGRAEVLR
ncbi:choice-of-anchor J domain-containing protein [Ferruginibacter sp. SUN106]|uniref:choice-of-anchor J domain-containing protein n=1 Tax=Ferruginibacter sp. SUN106 TaxID=2978348 RepID=UPI003D36A7A0